MLYPDLDLDDNRQTSHRVYHADVAEGMNIVSFQSRFEGCHSVALVTVSAWRLLQDGNSCRKEGIPEHYSIRLYVSAREAP